MKWYDKSIKEPPKDQRFLANTLMGIEMMEWKQRIIDGQHAGFFAYYCPCACCSGHCSDSFDLWAYLPEEPKV